MYTKKTYGKIYEVGILQENLNNVVNTLKPYIYKDLYNRIKRTIGKTDSETGYIIGFYKDFILAWYNGETMTHEGVDGVVFQIIHLDKLLKNELKNKDKSENKPVYRDVPVVNNTIGNPTVMNELFNM